MQIIPYKHIHNLLMILPFAIIVLLAVACYNTSNRAEVDRLNDISYSYHYRILTLHKCTPNVHSNTRIIMATDVQRR